MKQSIFVISALSLLAFFTSCEKFELEDHCPEEEQNETFENPQELRVNDDSDSEESGSSSNQTTRGFSSDSESGIKGDQKSAIGKPDGSGDDADEDGEDLINDDSDNEDEGADQSRRPGGSGTSSSDASSVK